MADFSKDVNDFLPLSPAVLYILLGLSVRPMHGYGIMQEVDRMSGGKVKMGPGTLYGTIKRMLRDGLIEEVDDHVSSASDRDNRRRYYQLTETGRKILSAEAERLANLMAVIREKSLLIKSDITMEYQSGP